MRTPDTDAQGNRLSFSQLDRLYSVKAGLAAGIGIGFLNFGILPYTQLGVSLAERRGARSIISVLSAARVFGMTVAYIGINDALTYATAEQAYSHERPALTRSFIGFTSGAFGLGVVRAITSGLRGSFPIMLVGAMGGTGVEFLEYRLEARREAARNQAESGGILRTLSQSQYIPLQSLSDKEYGDRLREKLALVEREIQSIDDEITAVQSTPESPYSR